MGEVYHHPALGPDSRLASIPFGPTDCSLVEQVERGTPRGTRGSRGPARFAEAVTLGRAE